MPNNDYILRSDALKAILGVSIYDTIEELEGARTIAENTWADGLYDAYKIIEEEVDAADVEPKQRWIPVTERLPDFTDRFIIVLKRNDEYVPKDEEWDESYLRVTKFDVDTGNWCLSKRVKKCTEVTHWMPLPSFPSEEGLK